jgi:hypothetical protein
MLPVIAAFCRLWEPGPDSYRDVKIEWIYGRKGTQILKIVMVAYDLLHK